jgi:hypothetical protein
MLLAVSCNDLGKKIASESSTESVNAKKETTKISPPKKKSTNKSGKSFSLTDRAVEISTYVQQKGFSTRYCFLIDMSLHSGRNRFFVYDLEQQSVAYAGLVAHGSCNERFLDRGRFSNLSNSGCSSLGKYKVGAFYHGSYGASFKLHGLDRSNSNAFPRGVVIHGYDCVPNEEIYPRVLCNSLGCPMVSYDFFDRLSKIIKKSERPILLWIYR